MSRPRLASDARSLVDGEPVSLFGIVRSRGPLLHAPLSGQPCVVHTTHARVWSRLDFCGVLVEELTVTEAAQFTLETPYGDLLVDASHAIIDGPAQHFVPPYHPGIHALLAPRGHAHLVDSTFASHRLVAPDALIALAGVALREHASPDGEHGYRDDTARFKLVGYGQHPLRITLPR